MIVILVGGVLWINVHRDKFVIVFIIAFMVAGMIAKDSMWKR